MVVNRMERIQVDGNSPDVPYRRSYSVGLELLTVGNKNTWVGSRIGGDRDSLVIGFTNGGDRIHQWWWVGGIYI
jgi:hypothetical protein